ncbi:MAG: hypothetical protein JST20_11080 [Bacteroidetes bacterium]|jgi:hypothetical protein|nr:hypothetical protein [Bacteroidota bacterium]
MNLILAILLYFNSLSTGQTYTWEEILALTASEQQNIESVQQNQEQLLQIQQEFGEQANSLVIKNRPENY